MEVENRLPFFFFAGFPGIKKNGVDRVCLPWRWFRSLNQIAFHFKKYIKLILLYKKYISLNTLPDLMSFFFSLNEGI